MCGELHREEQRDEGDEPVERGTEVLGGHGTHFRHPGIPQQTTTLVQTMPKNSPFSEM